MRFAAVQIRIVALISFLLSICACQSAQKPVSLLPPATAPALKAPSQSTATTQASAQASAVQGSQQAKETTNDPPSTDDSQATPPAQTAPPDAIADLISRVEKEYQAGLTTYQAGDTDGAKQHFDNAFNALLDSNFDVRSDVRLQNEFDRIVNGVDQLNLGGNQTADADQQQKSEPAPIDETNGLTPAADASTKAKVAAEVKNTHSDLPLMMTDQVAGYISYFSGRGRPVFERALARSGRYHDMIVKTLKQEGVPQDLIYLAQAESGFHPLAVSRAGARGIWQFMSSRARGYGLNHDMWLDDRQDPELSTRAAARHLKDLYEQFGDWYLAMAAYNSGPGTVQAAVKRTGYADFWELYRRNVLPKETRNYVPIILAVTIMAKNPSQYGLDSVVMEHPADYDTVTINYPVDLRLVAECVGSTPAELQDLNPRLLRMSTPRQGKFELHLPAGTKDEYENEIASIPADMRLWWRYHTVHTGDTLASLARTYHVTSKSLIEVNHLDGSELETDAKLVIPVAAGRHAESDTATYARRITRYKVHRGDTVETVADNFGVSPRMIRRWNGLRGDSLQGRRVLALHLPISPSAHSAELASGHTIKKHPTTQTASAKPPATKSAEIATLRDEEATREREKEATVVHHRVRVGETLYSIANLYKTTVEALKRDNRNVAVLHPGMILNVPVQ
ncbi:MAG TPA: transglycosylase SLT domain-containing protein [Verrucomicrobiae bacterium]|jgi:membrane-bound lytic murein transglycosylase D|nr:transglycosylase SLT domain-containing protein [Verrucomicrobiae bacterium]